jgi:hypothetical protein
MTFLPCADAVDVLEVVRQKGELELEALSAAALDAGRWTLDAGCRLTQSGLLAATRLLATSLLCYDMT